MGAFCEGGASALCSPLALGRRRIVAAGGGDDDRAGARLGVALDAEAVQDGQGRPGDRHRRPQRRRVQRAAAYKGLTGQEAEPGGTSASHLTKNSDYVPNLSSLAREKNDLVVANGFLMARRPRSGQSPPDTKFAIIDSPQAAMKSKPKNVKGLLFKENEAGYVVGYMAGLYARTRAESRSLGGRRPEDGRQDYIAGDQEGANAANPDQDALRVLAASSPWTKCKELALNQIAEGSQVDFPAAGRCGLGALDAARKGQAGHRRRRGPAYLDPQIMTSALKKVDAPSSRPPRSGRPTVRPVRTTGPAARSAASASARQRRGGQVQAKVEEVAREDQSGEITDIADTAK